MDGWREVMDGRKIQNVWWGALEPTVEGEEPTAWGCPFEPRVEPWLGVEPRLDGLAWLGCGSHPIRRKADKRLRLD
ncbi:hypothetical protein CRG98_010102 [Punica granatum]|uniref:Uncharacterized protein n=1 Tax=Punica granatum TaxID=22663 RepID=A0A2I0KM19_PUNGR|nr:hypothetical protein CRG98_010102 [Punica granatum]